MFLKSYLVPFEKNPRVLSETWGKNRGLGVVRERDPPPSSPRLRGEGTDQQRG
jgi:hypothetical protein